MEDHPLLPAFTVCVVGIVLIRLGIEAFNFLYNEWNRSKVRVDVRPSEAFVPLAGVQSNSGTAVYPGSRVLALVLSPNARHRDFLELVYVDRTRQERILASVTVPLGRREAQHIELGENGAQPIERVGKYFIRYIR